MLDYGWPNANPNANVNVNVNANANPSILDPYADFSQFPYPAFYDSFLNLEPNGVMLMPKTEPDFNTRLGLNLGLGGRTYFASSEDDFLTRRSRILDPNSVRCQAEGCNADLTHAKHYHRRHKVCEFHSKAATVIAAGLTQRFCQQCSRFHLLSEFDNGKRSCRKRLADHNRRRRKSHQDNNIKVDDNTPSENLQRDSSSVTVAVSPPPMISLSYIHGGSTASSFN